jgi:hypothetical protein
VTKVGISIVVIPVDSNAEYPMMTSCEPAANVTVARLVHSLKTLCSISVTVAGISIVVIPVDRNALTPMVASCEPAANVTPVSVVHP